MNKAAARAKTENLCLTSPEPKCQLTWNWENSWICFDQKSKMVTILRMHFELLLQNRKANRLETWYDEVSGWLENQT